MNYRKDFKRNGGRTMIDLKYLSRVKRPSGGFTLIEILLVVIIILAISSMIAPRLVGRGEQAKQKLAKAEIDGNLSTALKLYELENGNFPTSGQGLQALKAKPAISPVPENWNGPYIEKDPMDPWGNAYVYVSPGKHRPDYDLYSKGKDETSEEDDIVNWE